MRNTKNQSNRAGVWGCGGNPHKTGSVKKKRKKKLKY